MLHNLWRRQIKTSENILAKVRAYDEKSTVPIKDATDNNAELEQQ
jgi:hypothetical protein